MVLPVRLSYRFSADECLMHREYSSGRPAQSGALQYRLRGSVLRVRLAYGISE